MHSKFFPAMTGPSSKMSSSTGQDKTVFLTDDLDSIGEKIKKYAFSGAPKTLAEHREKGQFGPGPFYARVLSRRLPAVCLPVSLGSALAE